jgi:ribonucleoside-diphosphate reductase alpha chain
MQIERLYTIAGQHLSGAVSPLADASLAEPMVWDGDDDAVAAQVAVPQDWPALGAELLSRRLARQGGVPSRLRAIPEPGMPEWLWRREADLEALADLPAEARHTSERDLEQIVTRMAGGLTYAGWKQGVFADAEAARCFFDELRSTLVQRRVSPAAQSWAVLGLWWAYGLGEGVDSAPLTSAVVSAARGERYAGAVHSTNIDDLPPAGTLLPDGERAPGAVAWLRAADQAAAARAKLTGQARDERAVIDIGHTEIDAVLGWKASEEYKAAAMACGSAVLARTLRAVMVACADRSLGDRGYEPQHNAALHSAIVAARGAMVPESAIAKVLDFARQGFTDISFPEFDTEWDSEVWASVGGQHVSLTVRVDDAFLQSAAHTAAARARLDGLLEANWGHGDPALLFTDAVAAWNPIAATHPHLLPGASGDVLLPSGSAAPQATLNLSAFLNASGRLDGAGLTHTCRLWVLALDIMVGMAHSASTNTRALRPIALGYAGLGAVVLAYGVAYDSPAGRALGASVAALVGGAAASASAELAQTLGAFPVFTANRTPLLRVLSNQARAAAGGVQALDGVATPPPMPKPAQCPDPALTAAATTLWQHALQLAQSHGLRNAHLTALSPGGAALLLLGTDAASIDPIPAPVLTLAGPAGFRRQIHPSIPMALAALGYEPAVAARIVGHVAGFGSLRHAPALDHRALRAHGLSREDIDSIEAALPLVSDVRHAVTRWTVSEDTLFHLYQADMTADEDETDMLTHLGFDEKTIAAANRHVYGLGHFAGAVDLQPRHAVVFDGQRAADSAGGGQVSASGQVLMAAAIQPFLSGCVGRNVPLAPETGLGAIDDLVQLAWQTGLRSLAPYREGCRLSQARTINLGLALDAPAEQSAPLARPEAGPAGRLVEGVAEQVAERVVERIVRQAHREKLPGRRKGYTQKASVGGHKVYLRTGEYEDGRLGEIFLDLHKEGPAFRSLVNNFAVAVSLGLQFGVPLEEYVEAFTFTRFEPAGVVQGNETIRMATSVLDYVFRELAISYLGRADLAHATSADLLPDALGTGESQSALPVIHPAASTGYVRAGLRVVGGGARKTRGHQPPSGGAAG